MPILIDYSENMIPELKNQFDTIIMLNKGKALTEHLDYTIIPSVEFHPDILYKFFEHTYNEGFKEGIRIRDKKILNFNMGISIIKDEALEDHPMIVMNYNPLYSITINAHSLISLKSKMTRWEKIKTLYSICKSVLDYLSDKKHDSKYK